jgi:hypothetical protein
MNGRRSVNSGLIATKLGEKEQGKCQLSLSLFFSSTRAIPPKELSEKFVPIPGGGHATNFDWMLLPQFYSICAET